MSSNEGIERKSKQRKITDSFQPKGRDVDGDSLKIKIPRASTSRLTDIQKLILPEPDSESMITKMIESGSKKNWTPTELKQAQQELTQHHKESEEKKSKLDNELKKITIWKESRDKQIQQPTLQGDDIMQQLKDAVQSPAPMMSMTTSPTGFDTTSPIQTPLMLTPMTGMISDKQKPMPDYFMNPATPLNTFDVPQSPQVGGKRKYTMEEPTSPQVISPEQSMPSTPMTKTFGQRKRKLENIAPLQVNNNKRSRSKIIDDEDDDYRVDDVESPSDVSDEDYDMTKDEDDDDEMDEFTGASSPALMQTSAKSNIDSSQPQPTASKKRTSTKSGKKGRSKGKTSRSKTLHEEEDLELPEEEHEEEDLLAPEETQSPITPSKSGSKKKSAASRGKRSGTTSTPGQPRRRRKRLTNQAQEEESLGSDDEVQTTSTSKTPKTIFGQFWEYVDLHFGYISAKKFELLREQSEDDEPFKIPPLGRQSEDGEEIPIDDSKWIRKFGTTGQCEHSKLDVDWAARSAFSTPSLTQRLLASLVDDNDIVPLDDILSPKNLYHDGTSASAVEYNKKKKSKSKLAPVNDAYLRQGILSVASAPIPPPGSVILPTRKQSEVEKIQQEDTTRMSTNFSKYQQTKQGQRIRSNVNSVLQALQDNHGVLQNISVSSSDYDEGAMDLFEDRLVSELKNIGVLDERFDSKTVVGFPSRREDDEISAELRVLQAQLLERTQPTNEIKRKIHSRVKKALKEERERERKDNEMKEIEKEWNRHLESMKAVQKK